MDGSTVWGNSGGANGLDKLAPFLGQQTVGINSASAGQQQQPDAGSVVQGLLQPGLSQDALASTNTSDPNSVLRLQQSLQRLYGSLGQLHGSRASLPDIQEEGEANHANAAANANRLGGPSAAPISTPALQAPPPGRSFSEEDLFRMDQMPGGAQQLADLSLVGQMPSDGAESRTLFVRGIEPASSDEELMKFFEYFGDVRALYSAAKSRGMVVIAYHDIRAATLAHHTLNGSDSKFRSLSCQFTRPKDTVEAASGSILVFAVDNTFQTRQDILLVLSKYGELREIKDDPARPSCWVAEYYDARHAASAIQDIPRSPQSAGRLLVLDAGSVAASQQQQSGGGMGGGGQHQQLRNTASSPSLGALGGGGHQMDTSGLLLGGGGNYHLGGGGGQDLAGMTRSLSEMSLEAGASANTGMFGNAGGNAAAASLMGRLQAGSMSANDLMSVAAANQSMQGLGGMRGAASTGSLWTQGSANGLGGASLGSSPLGGGVWPQGVGSLAALQQEQQAAQQVAYLQQQQQNALVQTAAMQAALQQALLVQQAQQAAFARQHPVIGGMPRRGFSEPALGGRLARRPTDPVAEAERRAQQERLYSLDLQKIMAGEDKRTTLMVKNIPNKYTQKMLLSLIEERFRGTFDFFYLPIDFKNRCNVGYAFINMTTPFHIPPLVKEFHGKRWPKFNSEKICHIAYARIQGKSALVQHFQNSSLLHEDKRCRPVLFKADGQGGVGELEAFPLGPAQLLADAAAAAAGNGGGAVSGGGVE